MRFAPAIWVFALVLALSAGGVGAAETGPAKLEPAKGAFDSTPILHNAPDGSSKDSSGEADRGPGMQWPRVAAALAIVIGIILLLRWGGQRLFTTPTLQGSTRAVQVLSRSALAPRQHILLVRVGKRVLVVADTGTQMSPLCDISDADEVASLIGQIREEKTTAAARPFGLLFGRAKQEMPTDGDEQEEAPPHPIEQDLNDISEEDDAALATTRNELSGLAEKIRLVSRQLKNG